MVRQLSKALFTLTFDYDSGETQTQHYDLLMIRGIRGSNGDRPDYITVTCNSEEQGYVLSNDTITLIDSLKHILSMGTDNRIRLRPTWFNSLVHGDASMTAEALYLQEKNTRMQANMLSMMLSSQEGKIHGNKSTNTDRAFRGR